MIPCFGNYLACGVQKKDRRKALNPVLLGQLAILLLERVGQLLVVWIVQLHEDKSLGSLGLELVLVEDLALQFHAPAAPVGTGEVDQQQSILVLGFLLGCLEIGHPKMIFLSRCRRIRGRHARAGIRFVV